MEAKEKYRMDAQKAIDVWNTSAQNDRGNVLENPLYYIPKDNEKILISLPFLVFTLHQNYGIIVV